MRVRGHKGDQDQIGSVCMRTRDDITGPRAGYRADGGAVALMVELMSCDRSLPASAPFPHTIVGNQSECYGTVMLFGRSETS